MAKKQVLWLKTAVSLKISGNKCCAKKRRREGKNVMTCLNRALCCNQQKVTCVNSGRKSWGIVLIRAFNKGEKTRQTREKTGWKKRERKKEGGDRERERKRAIQQMVDLARPLPCSLCKRLSGKSTDPGASLTYWGITIMARLQSQMAPMSIITDILLLFTWTTNDTLLFSYVMVRIVFTLRCTKCWYTPSK